MNILDMVSSELENMGLGNLKRKKDCVEGAIRKWMRPVSLFIAELFLLLIVCIYSSKICIMGMGLLEGDYSGREVEFLIMCVFDIAMMFLSLDSIIGISSRKPQSWRKVIRAGFLLMVISVLNWIVGISIPGDLTTVNPLVLLPLVAIIIAIMFRCKVRRYYTPPLVEEKPLGEWIKYAVNAQAFDSESYRICYQNK